MRYFCQTVFHPYSILAHTFPDFFPVGKCLYVIPDFLPTFPDRGNPVRSIIKNGYFLCSLSQWCSGTATWGGWEEISPIVRLWSSFERWIIFGLFLFFLFFSLHLISGTKTLQVSVKTFVFGLFLICSKAS